MLTCLFFFVKESGQGFGKLQQTMVPLACIIHPKHRAAQFIGGVLPQGHGQCDPGSAALGLVDEHGAAMGGCRVADQHHAQADADHPADVDWYDNGICYAPDVVEKDGKYYLYMRMARTWSENSYCVRRKVGAILVKDQMIISDGYNGTPSGFENVCEDENNVSKPYVLHAEANALTKVARSHNSSNGATLYVTASPCMECAKLIIQSGIKRVVYGEKYRIMDGVELLEREGVQVDFMPDTPASNL